MIMLKWIVNKIVLFLELIFHHNSGRSGIFQKFVEVILHKNNKQLQKFCNWSFLRMDSGPWFTLIGYLNFFKLLKSWLMLKKREQHFINTKLITKWCIKNFPCNSVILCHSLFSGPKVRQVVLLSGPKLEPNLLNDNDKKLGNAAVERIMLKCNHKTIFGD